MKLLQRGTVALFFLVLAAYLGLNLYLRLSVDRTPPVITCDSEVVEIRRGTDESVLLKGVTATDDVDGDVTRSIMIKGVSQLITADTAKVTYIAFDSSNNRSEKSRTVRYTDYEKPRFALDQPLIYRVGSKVQLLDRLTASDVVDGDISGNIRVTTQNINASVEGGYAVTVQVSNSLGDVESIPLTVQVSNGTYSTPVVTLSDYILYLETGDTFRPADYILTPADPTLVRVDASAVDTATPGVYEVFYSCQADTVIMTVVVR